MDNFKQELAEVLEVDSVNEGDALKDFDSWDSLTILSIIALASENYDVTLSAAEINQAGTVGGLENLVAQKKNG